MSTQQEAPTYPPNAGALTLPESPRGLDESGAPGFEDEAQAWAPNAPIHLFEGLLDKPSAPDYSEEREK